MGIIALCYYLYAIGFLKKAGTVLGFGFTSATVLWQNVNQWGRNMKTIIAGGRTITDFQLAFDAIAASHFDITEVVSGCARGADQLGEDWAAHNRIPCRHFAADWIKFGIAAGPMRNTEMAEYADALIAIWDGQSKGTAHMIKTARKLKMHVYIHYTPDATKQKNLWDQCSGTRDF